MRKQPISKNHPDYFPQVALLIVGVFLFSYPWLSLFNHRTPVLGIPQILFYIFGIWLVLIVISARMGPRS